SSRAHLSWGAGPRQCPARELASTIASAGVSRLFERFGHLELALPVDQLPWRSSPFMRGLRSLPVRYELTGPVEPVVTATPEPDAAVPVEPVDSVKRRSSLWRYLTGLIRSGGLTGADGTDGG
ncbi:MAG: cytochrome, partial [Streptomyces sp.]|nr:cytochrome [Streptomyces sp.]